MKDTFSERERLIERERPTSIKCVLMSQMESGVSQQEGRKQRLQERDVYMYIKRERYVERESQ